MECEGENDEMCGEGIGVWGCKIGKGEEAMKVVEKEQAMGWKAWLC